MKTITLCAGVVLCLGLMALPIGAHHCTSAVYDETKTIEVTGKVVEWQVVAGAVIRRIPSRLGTVIARGAPARNESVRGLLIRGNLTRPDGKRIP